MIAFAWLKQVFRMGHNITSSEKYLHKHFLTDLISASYGTCANIWNAFANTWNSFELGSIPLLCSCVCLNLRPGLILESYIWIYSDTAIVCFYLPSPPAHTKCCLFLFKYIQYNFWLVCIIRNIRGNSKFSPLAGRSSLVIDWSLLYSRVFLPAGNLLVEVLKLRSAILLNKVLCISCLLWGWMVFIYVVWKKNSLCINYEVKFSGLCYWGSLTGLP